MDGNQIILIPELVFSMLRHPVFTIIVSSPVSGVQFF